MDCALMFFFVGFWVHFVFLCFGLCGVLKFLCTILIWAMLKRRRVRATVLLVNYEE